VGCPRCRDKAIEKNETAVDILVAQRRTEIGIWPISGVIRELAAGQDIDTVAD
jgi:hypothetical protein